MHAAAVAAGRLHSAASRSDQHCALVHVWAVLRIRIRVLRIRTKGTDNPNKANDNPNKATDDAGRKRSDRDQHCAFGRVGGTLLEALDLNVERIAVCLQLLQSTQRCLVRA